MGNPHYKDVLTFESYKQRCKDSENDFKLIFGENISESEELDEDQENQSNEDNLKDEIDLEEYETKDPVRKYQIQYDESIVMADKFPEISVAPGEDQKPQNMLFDKNWDVMAFPALHNLDGSNGKDEERDVKLTDQKYFIQRITNLNSRFAKCPTYLYAAVGYLEQMQISRNLNLVGTRGQKITSSEGKSKYELLDPYRSIEAIPGTPKYWQRAKYEMLAKIDNFGAFNIFFTLSCADLRWDPNLAAILLERGYSMHFDVQMKDGHWKQIIEVYSSNGESKSIEDFVKDENESYHEMIRGNVVKATRYFDHCVKSFLRNIVLQKSNSLSVKFYTYKVEFQARGAGHIHGTLWLDLQKLETLIRKNGRLTFAEKEDSFENRPLKGISKAFKNLRSRGVHYSHNTPSNCWSRCF